jgi:ribokinase
VLTKKAKLSFNCKSFIFLLPTKILICQLEVPLDATIEALKSFKGGISILNAAPALSSLPDDVLGLANIFCVNELEAEALTGIAFSTIRNAKAMVENLVMRGCKTVIITLGKHGAVANTENGQIFHVPVPQKMNDIAVQDSTGGFLKRLLL